jgi:hypothetical protein
LVTTLMSAPERPPNSAEYPAVSTLTSSIVSRLGLVMALVLPPLSMLSAPSTMK